MLRFLADENFNATITRGLLRRQPALDIVAVQDVGLSEADDPIVLEWAARQGRVTVTHDINTMPGFAAQRINARQRLSGLVIAPADLPIRQVIEDLLLIAECSDDDEWNDRIEYLPLR